MWAQWLLGEHISGAQGIEQPVLWQPFLVRAQVASTASSCCLKLAACTRGLAACLPPAAGADVTHPMGFNKVIPSIASVVASLNRHATIYCERSRLQAHRTEIIQVGAHCNPGLCST